jgi:hypothetical protein
VELSGGSVAAMVTGTTVVGGGATVPSTTLRRLTVASGMLATGLFARDFVVDFLAVLFDAVFLAGPFTEALLIAVLVAAPVCEGMTKESVLSNSKADDEQPTNLAALRFVNQSCMEASGEGRVGGC